ncbi:MAG: SDR family NAD(P)-dependent oxidoreductase [Propionibacteriaceae bacterium]|jgi:NAD(P)-dependent dehydrogenase (short-subunit alcohol dehydrogenase family)|nr:SDR family NAD(P)-dependent oxidoreductase [Propionibacteriaceae bacterium]
MAHWTPERIPSQSGRTALITGAASGIGLETAKFLAGRGARIIMAGRDPAKLEAAAALIRQTAPDAQLDPLVVDLANLASVAQAAGQVAASETVDILVNNAGVMGFPTRQTTADGLEAIFGVNHLGHFAFDAQVWPAVRRSTQARVITVSAVAAGWKMALLDDLMSERRYRSAAAYAKSKRANLVYTVELARRLSGQPIMAVAAHPGGAPTNLQRHTRGLERFFTSLAKPLVIGSLEGATWPLLYAIASPDVRAGQFIGPAARDQTAAVPKTEMLPAIVADPAEGRRLWDDSERLTGVAFKP